MSMELAEKPVDVRADPGVAERTSGRPCDNVSAEQVGTASQCLVCGSYQRWMFEYQGHQYHRCVSCGLVSTYPLPDAAAIEAHYAENFERGNYQLLREQATAYARVYCRFADALEQAFAARGRSLKGAAILDVGCFTGGLLLELQRRGADVFGLELQKEAVELANERLPGRVFQADVRGNGFPTMELDAVTLMGVIEHVLDPAGLLRRAAQLLKPGGFLLLRTPDSASLPARLLGKLWPPYAPVEHIHLFSRQSLRALLGQQGFAEIKCRQQWKRLPVAYVYNMFQTFGPELHRLFAPLYWMLPGFVRELTLPFYVGGVVLTAKRTSKPPCPSPRSSGGVP